MVKEKYFIIMEIIMKDSFVFQKRLVREYINGKMKLNILVNLKKILC